MAILTDRFILYHIPKTGGTWGKVALKNAGVEYRYTKTMKGEHPFNLKRAHSTPDNVPAKAKEGRLGITFVREPEAWYRSYWAFRSRKGARRDEKFPADGLWSDDFDQFVNNILDAYPQGFVTTLYQYYTGAECEKVDFVGRQEYLLSDLIHALDAAGESFDEGKLAMTPRRNASPNKWKEAAVLTPETQQRIRECEHWVLETFYA